MVNSRTTESGPRFGVSMNLHPSSFRIPSGIFTPLRCCGLLLSLPGICGLAAIAAERPNVLFVLADDMGWQDTSVAFAEERTKINDRFHTPALERLAREGMKFTQAYSCAVCSPKRVSFLTGQNTPRHGVTQWTHLTGDKPSPDLPHPEGGIRVPLLVRWPGMTKAASVNETPVTIYDWFPTFLKVAGASAPEQMDGLDLAPLLSGAEAPATFDRPLVWHFPNFWGPLSASGPVEGPGMGPSSTIRKGDWKLIYHHGDQRFELFDLAIDLGETTNFAEQEPECVRELAVELSDILRQYKAPMPVVKVTGKQQSWPDASFQP